MLCSRRVLQQWCFALFLLCSPVPHNGRPIDALSNRTKRSVTHAQLMHDKGRTIQDHKRRMWLQDLLDEVHTADIDELPARAAAANHGPAISLPVASETIHLSTTGSTLHSKPPGGTKNLPISFRLDEEEEGTNLPQETNKSQTYKDGALKTSGKKKKKGRSGKRREGGEKRKRRARAVSWTAAGDEHGRGYHREWRALFGLKRPLH